MRIIMCIILIFLVVVILNMSDGWEYENSSPWWSLFCDIVRLLIMAGTVSLCVVLVLEVY